jgi:hypothetical protein
LIRETAQTKQVSWTTNKGKFIKQYNTISHCNYFPTKSRQFKSKVDKLKRFSTGTRNAYPILQLTFNVGWYCDTNEGINTDLYYFEKRVMNIENNGCFCNCSNPQCLLVTTSIRFLHQTTSKLGTNRIRPLPSKAKVLLQVHAHRTAWLGLVNN